MSLDCVSGRPSPEDIITEVLRSEHLYSEAPRVAHRVAQRLAAALEPEAYPATTCPVIFGLSGRLEWCAVRFAVAHEREEVAV